MGLATSEEMFILLLVNTATSFAMFKELFRVILHAVGINLPFDDCSDHCSAAWSNPSVSSDSCLARKCYTQQLIEDFRCWSVTTHLFQDCVPETVPLYSKNVQFALKTLSPSLKSTSSDADISSLQDSHDALGRRS